MEILILSVFLISIFIYYIYKNGNRRENRQYFKYHILRLLVNNNSMTSDDLVKQINEKQDKKKLTEEEIQKTIYEMIQEGLLHVDGDMNVKLASGFTFKSRGKAGKDEEV